MTRRRAAAAFLAACSCFASIGISSAGSEKTGAKPRPGSHSAWDAMTSLVGEWEGRDEQGHAKRAQYRLVSNGTVLMETLDSSEDTEMVTLYSLDGDRLVMTHYCSIGNQPRMSAKTGADPARIEFEFQDATNLSSPATGHMTGLVVIRKDAGHFAQRWTFSEAGKAQTEVFEFARRK